MKKFNKIILAVCVVFIGVFSAFIMSGCNEISNEGMYTQEQYDRVSEMLEHYRDNDHQFGTEYESDEVGHYHVCSVCGEETEKEEHTFEFYELTDNNFLVYRCTECGYEHRFPYTTHKYEVVEVDYDELSITFRCSDCEDEETRDLITIHNEDAVGGTCEVAYSDNSYAIIKPVAEDGYYFDHYDFVCDTYFSVGGMSHTEYTQQFPYDENKFVINDEYFCLYQYTPVFTQTQSEYTNVAVEVYLDGELVVNDETLCEYTARLEEYSTSTGTETETVYHFFFPENNNVVLDSASIEYIEGNVRNTVGILDRKNPPYILNQILSTNFGEPNRFVLNFIDVTGKYLVCIDRTDVSNDNYVLVCSPNETITINTYYDGSSLYGGEVISWTDEDGTVLSTKDEFEYTVTKNTKIYLNVKGCDITWENNNGNQFYFIRVDNGLKLTGFSHSQLSEITIPSIVNDVPVIEIGVLTTGAGFGGTLTIPDSITKFAPGAFRYISIGSYYKALIKFESERTDLCASDFMGCSGRALFDFSQKTIRAMVNNELHKLVSDDVELTVTFSTEMAENTLGFYTHGTRDITLKQLSENNYYARTVLNVIVHELRHFYQAIAIEDVEGLDLNDLVVLPTDNQIGAWKYLPYTDSSENYNAYYYNAREVDSREYAYSVVGFDIA